MISRSSAVALVAVLAFGSACSSAVTSDNLAESVTDATAEPGLSQEVSQEVSQGVSQEVSQEVSQGAGVDESAIGLAASDRAAPQPPATTPQRTQAGGTDPLPAQALGDRIIKEGSIRVEVADGSFQSAFDAVIRAARSFGGDVVGTTTNTDQDGSTSGTVTVRVPVERYEDLLTGLGGVGQIVRRDINSQDVSAEFVDLQSRIRQLQAEERFFLDLFDRAESIGDAITVRQQLSDVQSQIERLRGRLQLLEDRTAFSSLAVELFEPGSTPVSMNAANDRPSLSRYYDSARDAFINVIGALLVTLLFAAPLLILGLLGWLLWRALRPSRKRAVTPESSAVSPPAADVVTVGTQE